ncbi:MAG: large-conductance mechanosensitive channel protein MscL [Candidatus Omnitrophica bacterium]|nr:large-conductance mechanosensitive channel protein MscL [Candidatus Omnitrophota bacterium]
MKFVDEFKAFVMRGNVVDMAVGIIIGAAFGKIIASLVSDIMMPPLGFLIGGVDFSSLELVIKSEFGRAPVTIKYGLFLNNIFSFLIVAFAVFILIKGMSALQKKEEAKPVVPPPPSAEATLLAEIRDLLKKK